MRGARKTRLQIRWSHSYSVNNISPGFPSPVPKWRGRTIHGQKSESNDNTGLRRGELGSNMDEWPRPVSNLSSAYVLRTASNLLEAFNHQALVKTVMLF